MLLTSWVAGEALHLVPDSFMQHDMLRLTTVKFGCRKFLHRPFATRLDSVIDHRISGGRAIRHRRDDQGLWYE